MPRLPELPDLRNKELDAAMELMIKNKKLLDKLQKQVDIRSEVIRASAVQNNAKKFDYYSKEKTRNQLDYERKLKELKDEYTRYDEYCNKGMNPDTSAEEAKDKVLIKYNEELKIAKEAHKSAEERHAKEQEKDTNQRIWNQRQALNELEREEEEEKLSLIQKAKEDKVLFEAERERRKNDNIKKDELEEKAKEYNKKVAEMKTCKSDEFRDKYSPYSYVDKVKVCKEEEGKLTAREWYFYTKLLKHQRSSILELSDLNDIREYLNEAKKYIIMTDLFESDNGNLTDEEWDVYYNVYTTSYHKEKIISLKDKVKRNKFILSLKKEFKNRDEDE
jgi:hypothetical protein